MTYTFTYPNYGTPPAYPGHVAHSGQPCEIVRELGDDERDEEVGPMFMARFADGVELLVLHDELMPHPSSVTLVLRDDGWWSITRQHSTEGVSK